jgi:arylsulfatase A-like enzyme
MEALSSRAGLTASALALFAALTMTIALAGAGGAAEARGGADRPNVVVVMTDDQHQASLAAMDNVQSSLVAKGTTFANSFTNWPLCCPSRATLYTGQYAHNHGVLGNGPPQGGFENFDDSNALPLWMQSAGYRTIQIGKYLNGYGEATTDPAYVPPGWDEWMVGTAGTTQSVYDYKLNQNGTIVDYASAESDFKQDVFTDLAVDAIERNAARGPFMLNVMYTAPHSGGPNPSPQPPADCGASAKPAPRHASAFDAEPLPRPPSFNEADVSDKPAEIQTMPSIDDSDSATIQRRYRCRMESLLSVDDGVGRILGALRESGELDETLIVYTSDNGYFHGEHRVRTGKNRVYEEAARVPLVIRGPGVSAGKRADDLAINADLAPTVLDAAGGSADRVMDGRSLLPFAAHPERSHGRELLIEQYRGDDDEDGSADLRYEAVRTSRYVYVENEADRAELYDIEADPYQLQNQSGNPAFGAVEARLAQRLANLRTCSGAGCRAKPALKQKLSRSRRSGGRTCRPHSDLSVRVRGADAGALAEVSFRVGSKLSGRDRAAPFRKRIRPRLLRNKRRPEIRAIAELIDGRELSLQKRVRICR